MSDRADTASPTLARSSVRVVPSEPAWAARGAAIAAELGTRIGPLARRVDHVGSTAIPGMAAKAVYDRQVSVADLVQASPIIDAAVAPIGLTRMPWEQDHIPAGRHDRPERWIKRSWSNATRIGERINLHARLVGSPNARLALLFRDWFQAHPESMPAYARFKLQLATTVPDIDAYTDIKDPMVDLVVTVAEGWAAGAGWTVRATSTTD